MELARLVEMQNAEVLEFPYVATLAKAERSVVRKVWDHFQELREIVKEKGLLVPQHLAAELLGVSKQRVCTLCNEGRFEIVNVGGHRYLTENSLVAYAKEERKVGRPLTPKAGTWANSVEQACEFVTKISKESR